MFNIRERRLSYIGFSCLLPGAFRVLPGKHSPDPREITESIVQGLERTERVLDGYYARIFSPVKEPYKKTIAQALQNMAEEEWKWATGSGQEWLKQRGIDLEWYMKDYYESNNKPLDNLSGEQLNEFLKTKYIDLAIVNLASVRKPIKDVGKNGYLAMSDLMALKQLRDGLTEARVSNYLQQATEADQKLYLELKPYLSSSSQGFAEYTQYSMHQRVRELLEILPTLTDFSHKVSEANSDHTNPREVKKVVVPRIPMNGRL